MAADKITRKSLLQAEFDAMQEGKPFPRAGPTMINLSALGLYTLDRCAQRWRLSRSQIVDIICINLHKLRIVDLTDAPEPGADFDAEAPGVLPDDPNGPTKHRGANNRSDDTDDSDE